MITIQFGSGSFAIDSAEVVDSSGASLPLTLLTPENDQYLGGNAIAFYTNDPLDTQSTYDVTVEGTVNGSPWSKSWSFTTGNGGSNW